ncbi:MAG: ATP-binding protein [Nanoarchaeota archaeon]
MSYEIILGRDASDKEKFGDKGLINIGKGYVKMGNYTSLSNTILMDVARSHIVLVAGKRGSGKSYTLGVIMEELANLPPENAQNISSLIFDTMGIFWTMKYKNDKDADLLKKWNLESRPLNVKVFVPFGKSEEYKQKGIPFDATFALEASELEAEDWLALFNLEVASPIGVLVENSITELKNNNLKYTLHEIQAQIEKDKRAKPETQDIAISLFKSADSWGVFSKTKSGTEISDLIAGGRTSVLDVSVYSSIAAFNIRAVVLSILARKLFQKRMDSRKKEELDALQHGQDYLSFRSSRDPLVWIFIDEAHEFLPKEGKTPATDALIQLLREGRQPGISVVLATQQPGQIHRDVMSQSDIVISHRVTSKADLEALNEIMQSYVLQGIKQQMDDLPTQKGSAIILDDNSERIYPIKMRPRFTWHGGEAPTSVKADMKL